MHPAFDPSKLTDDELMSRLLKATGYLYMQTQLGHDPTVESIKETIRALEYERDIRFQKQIKEEQVKKNPKAYDPVTLGELVAKPNKVFIDEEERARVAKIRRRPV